MTALGTHAGVILGTAAYMSPEQARGQAVDKRTDIWAFGCVHYELLTGRRVFAGDTVLDTLAAVLDRKPDWTRLPAGTPPGIRRRLRRCLEKEAKRRLRDIGDARLELEEACRVPRRRTLPKPQQDRLEALVDREAAKFWTRVERVRNPPTSSAAKTDGSLLPARNACSPC